MIRWNSTPLALTMRVAVLGLLSLGWIACSSSLPDDWNQSMQVDGPERAGDDLIYLNRTLEQIHRLEPTRSDGTLRLETTRVPTGDEPTSMALSPDEEQLFVLNDGARTLRVYDLTSQDLSYQDVQLESTYDRITVTPTGDFLLLTFASDSDQTKSCVVCNINEIGVVDLRDGVPESAQFISLDKRASDLVFAEPFEVGGAPQRLVAALSPSQITLIDLRAAAGGEGDEALREIALTVSEAESVRQPVEARFDIRSGENSPVAAYLYIRTERGRDITQIALSPSDSQEKTFDIAINQLAAGRGATAMALIEVADGTRRLMALDRSQSAFSLIDVQSGESESFPLPIGAAPTDMLLYDVASGDSSGNTPDPRVLVYSEQSEIVAVVRPNAISVSGRNPTLGRSVEAIRLEASPASIQLQSTARGTRAIAALQGGDSAVLKLRADDNVATPIQSPPLADLMFGPSTAWGVFQGRANLARYELETGHGTPYDLPEPGERVFLDADDELLTVQHGTQAGVFTVLDLSQLEPRSERDHARVFEGVFLERVLQQGYSTVSNED